MKLSCVACSLLTAAMILLSQGCGAQHPRYNPGECFVYGGTKLYKVIRVGQYAYEIMGPSRTIEVITFEQAEVATRPVDCFGEFK
jgi:hypothetical protein